MYAHHVQSKLSRRRYVNVTCTLCNMEKPKDEIKTASMTDKDQEQFVVLSSTTLDRMRENFFARILFCSEEQPGLRVLKNVNDVTQLLL